MKAFLNIFILIFICSCVSKQESILNEFMSNKNGILNVVLESEQFNKVVQTKNVHFKRNEILSPNVQLKLKRKGERINILNEEEIGFNRFIVLGDFTLLEEYPNKARVQIEVIPDGILLNFNLENENDNWIIKYHSVN